jgi:hypothetical protein
VNHIHFSAICHWHQNFDTLKRNMIKTRKGVSTPDDKLCIAITEG